MASTQSRFLSLLRLAASGGLATGVLLAHAASAQSPQPVEVGIWFNHTGKGAVQVYRCQQDQTRLCGRIVWLKNLLNKQGQPVTDGRNPKPAMRTRPICGLPVLGNLQRAPGGGWKGGWVYDPEKGAAYTASIRAKTPEVLTMTGYKGIFYKSYGWKRAPDDLPRCGELAPVEPVSASAG
ncbi:MAG: DUF2147 domain-containing protein [Alphaproteobacteria bacterium]|nr:DUF2147 domain-containing protein [Alphaproteobacteria bacterium]